MAEKDPCRYLGDDWFCAHPLMLHYNAKDGCGDVCAECEGCPCHEPQPAVVKESLTTQPAPNGSIRPESDEIAPVRVHDKP